MRPFVVSLCLALCAMPVLSRSDDSSPPPAADRPIAYLAHTQGYWQVWTMREDGSLGLQVTRTSYEKAHVSWYPDGRRVLVTSTDGRVYEVDVATGAERQLALPLAEVHDAVVAPDGREIILSANAADARDGNEIWAVGLDGQGVQRITRIPWLQHQPSVTPDGTWIYFASGDGQQAHDIFRASRDGRSIEQVTAGALYNFDPTASTTGMLAFSSNRSGDYELWLKAGEEPPVRVTDSRGLDGGASWSPSGRSLVFHSSRTGRLQIFRVDLDREDEGEFQSAQLTSSESGSRNPTWWRARDQETSR